MVSRKSYRRHKEVSSENSKYIIERDLRKFGNLGKRPLECEMRFAIEDAIQAFKLPSRVKMLHLNDVFQQDLEIWTSSPGLPWRDLGYKTMGEVRDDADAVQSIRRFWHFVKDGKKIKFPNCCAFGTNEVSVVWEYPATMTFGEAVFAIPLSRAFQKHDTPIAYGYETGLGGALKMKQLCDGAPYIVKLDFKSFNKTLPGWLMEVAFAILALNVDFVHYEDHGVPDARKMFDMFKKIQDYFINTKIQTASGVQFCKDSGLASGSQFTQLIGSICNYILINYMFRKTTGYPPQDLKVFGDDSIAYSTKKINIMDFQVIAIRLGMKLDINKSQVETDPNKVIGF